MMIMMMMMSNRQATIGYSHVHLYAKNHHSMA